MPHDQPIRTSSSAPRATTVIATLMFASLMPTIGCSELTSVRTLDVVQQSDLENRTGARALRAGAITRFTNAFVGDQWSQVVLSARISDELTATYTDDRYDRRDIPELYTPAGGPGGHRNLSQTRVSLLQAVHAMQRFDAGASADIAELFALLAYSELFLAENFCSGVPLSSMVNGEPIYGVQLSGEQMLEEALAHFDSAVAYAGAEHRALQLARIGRGRTLLNLDRAVDAAAAVTDVATGFSYTTSHATGVQQNGVWSMVSVGAFYTVADQEGGNGLNFISANDPRLETRIVGVVRDQIPVYEAQKYANASSPVVLASGIEARLIEAEALLQAGNPTGSLAKLNELRMRTPTLELLQLQETDALRVDQLFRERAFWLFLTGHRHGDLRRLIRQYGRGTESVFPSGSYSHGGNYGADVTLDIHVLEQNNPNFTGCFNRNP